MAKGRIKHGQKLSIQTKRWAYAAKATGNCENNAQTSIFPKKSNQHLLIQKRYT